jgi:hypothetical protein
MPLSGDATCPPDLHPDTILCLCPLHGPPRQASLISFLLNLLGWNRPIGKQLLQEGFGR